jgi:drug/metabolite transporter (DMT)-like permease
MWIGASFIEAPVKVPQLSITWIALIWLGVLGSGLAFIMNYYLIHEIGPTRTTMVTYIFPLGGVVLGVLFLHEQLTWQLLTGAGLIVISLVVANWQKRAQ